MDARRIWLVLSLSLALLGLSWALAGQVSAASPESTRDLYYFVIDRSASIGEKKLTDHFRKAVVEYVGKLNEEAQVEIVFFSNTATAPRSWYPMDMRAKDDFAKYFDENLRPNGQTLLYDTVADVLGRVKANEAQFRALTILILSDGEDNRSTKFKNWESLEQLLPEGWAKNRKGFSVIWATVGFDPPPEQRPSPGSIVTTRPVPDPKEIAKVFIPAPKAAFTANPTKVKVNEPVLFALDDDTNVTTANWSFGDGTVSNKKTDTHQFNATGTYDIAVDVAGEGGKARLEKKGLISVVEEVPMEAKFSWYPQAVRVNEKAKFVDESLGSPAAWSWEFPGVGKQKDRSPTVAFNKPGKITVTLTVEKEGKTHSTQRELEVLPLPPEAGFTAEPVELEMDQVLHLKASKNENGWTHKWLIGEDVQLAGEVVEWKADRKGRVEIVHSVMGPGGVADKGFTAFVKEKPEGLVARFRWSPTVVYVGDQIQFVDESSGAPKTWNWEISDTSPNQQRNPTLTFSKPGKVTVKLVIERDGLQASSQRALEVLPPIVNLQAKFEAAPVTGRAPLTVQFTDYSKGEISSWHWDFGDGSASDRQNPSHVYQEVKSYIPRLVIRNSKGEEATDAGGLAITATPPPLWLKILLGVIALLLLWVIVIVPLILRPLLAPHKGVTLRGTSVSFLRALAKRHASNLLWPCRSVTIGSGKCGDVKVGGVGQKNENLAVVSRVPASSNYELVPLQMNAVSEIKARKTPDSQDTIETVPLLPGKRRLLRNGEQFEIRGTTLTWVQPGGEKH
jgi:PKD repeat protein